MFESLFESPFNTLVTLYIAQRAARFLARWIVAIKTQQRIRSTEN